MFDLTDYRTHRHLFSRHRILHEDSRLDRATGLRTILNVYNARDVSNFSTLDLKSIMMYFMPAAMNEQNIDVKPNNVLSDIDKAFMTINYPYPTSHPPADNIWTVEHALDVAGAKLQSWCSMRCRSGPKSDTFSATLPGKLVSLIAFIPCNPAKGLPHRA